VKKQTKYFLIGGILLLCALFSITFLPLIIKFFTKLSIQKYIYVQIEFFLFVASSIFYLFSPKYYKQQILTILIAILYYYLFVLIYPNIYDLLLTYVTKMP